MKTYKEEQRMVRFLGNYICDWCDKEFEYKDDVPYFEDFTLEYKPYYSGYGDYWVESGNWHVDLCPECIERLKKLLVDNGCKLQEE